jgi:hypothetical protein
MNPNSLAQLKRHVGREARLVLAEIDGTLWASNRYWLVRAAWIQPFLDKYGITGPGVYDYDGHAAMPADLATDRAFAALAALAGITAYTTDLEPVSIGKFSRVYAHDGEHYLELLEDPGEVDPEPVAVRADWLYWLEDAPADLDDGHLYEMRLAATERHRPIAIIAQPLTEDEGFIPHLVAVVMPVVHQDLRDATPEEEALTESAAEAEAYFRSRES